MQPQPIPSPSELIRNLELAIAAEQNRPERLPGLVAVFNRLPDVSVVNLENLSALKPEIVLCDISVGRFSDMAEAPEGTVFGILRAERWNGNVYFLADAQAALAFVEATTGFDGDTRSGIAPRGLTVLERSIVSLLYMRLARSLAEAFSAFVDVTFEVTAIGDRDLIGGMSASAPTLVAKLKITFAGKEGFIRVVIPQKLLEPVRMELEVTPALPEEDAPVDGDPDWARQLTDEIARAFIVTKAILDERQISLQELANLKVGSTIGLSTTTISRARIEIDDRPLFWCEVGKNHQQMALRIETEFENNDDVVEEF